MGEKFDVSVLNAMKYRDLQDLCKKNGIRANQKSSNLIDKLLKLNESNENQNESASEKMLLTTDKSSILTKSTKSDKKLSPIKPDSDEDNSKAEKAVVESEKTTTLNKLSLKKGEKTSQKDNAEMLKVTNNLVISVESKKSPRLSSQKSSDVNKTENKNENVLIKEIKAKSSALDITCVQKNNVEKIENKEMQKVTSKAPKSSEKAQTLSQEQTKSPNEMKKKIISPTVIPQPRRSPRGELTNSTEGSKAEISETNIKKVSEKKKLISKIPSKKKVSYGISQADSNKNEDLKVKAKKSAAKKVGNNNKMNETSSSQRISSRRNITTNSESVEKSNDKSLSIQATPTKNSKANKLSTTSDAAKENKAPGEEKPRGYTPYKGPLPPFEGDSLFSPKKKVLIKKAKGINNSICEEVSSEPKQVKRVSVKKTLLEPKSHDTRRSKFIENEKKQQAKVISKKRKI